MQSLDWVYESRHPVVSGHSIQYTRTYELIRVRGWTYPAKLEVIENEASIQVTKLRLIIIQRQSKENAVFCVQQSVDSGTRWSTTLLWIMSSEIHKNHGICILRNIWVLNNLRTNTDNCAQNFWDFIWPDSFWNWKLDVDNIKVQYKSQSCKL